MQHDRAVQISCQTVTFCIEISSPINYFLFSFHFVYFYRVVSHFSQLHRVTLFNMVFQSFGYYWLPKGDFKICFRGYGRCP